MMDGIAKAEAIITMNISLQNNNRKELLFLLFQLKSTSRDGLLLLTSSQCDLTTGGAGVFPNKISSSSLKHGGQNCKRTFLMKEKRESIV